MAHKSIELADIINRYGEPYRQNNSLTSKQKKVLTNISNCRTEKLGYHQSTCSYCNHIEQRFNSCRDRHCPKCQRTIQRIWVEKRLATIVPVPYYHVVFTLPGQLFPLALYNQKFIYNLLFKAASDTLKIFAKDPKWLGGQLGFFGILHTWGQTLWHHPHLHFIVAGGALTKDGTWVRPAHKGKFLFPVHALSKVFKARFLKGLRKAFKKQSIRIPESMTDVNNNWCHQKYLRKLAEKKWVVYCKAPFKKAEHLLRYLGRYTHRVALSNNRIRSATNDTVSFTYRDYRKDRKKQKLMTLTATDFLQRFLWHVLPEQFHRIRHYGFLANGRVQASLDMILAALGTLKRQDKPSPEPSGFCCPVCGKGRMILSILVTASGFLAYRHPEYC